jgi:hypothetical protein
MFQTLNVSDPYSFPDSHSLLQSKLSLLSISIINYINAVEKNYIEAKRFTKLKKHRKMQKIKQRDIKGMQYCYHII